MDERQRGFPRDDERDGTEPVEQEHMPRRIPGESEGDFEAREEALPSEPDALPPGQESGQAGTNDITWRAGKPQKQAGAEDF